MERPLGSADEGALLVGDVEAEVPAAEDVPAAVKLFVHVLLDFLGHLLLVGTVFEGVADHVLGLVLRLRLHFRVERLHAPLLQSLLHL